MNKKWAILIVVVAMAVIYLFLLVVLPALTELVSSCGTASLEETDESRALTEASANWTTFPVNPTLRPIIGQYDPTWIIYSIPGLVGIYAVVVILKQKKEAK